MSPDAKLVTTMPIADDNYITADQVLFEKLPETGLTLIEAVTKRDFKLFRQKYCGDREDFQQALIVKFLDWVKDHPTPDKLRQSEVCGLLKTWGEEEGAANSRGAELGEDVAAVDPDTDSLYWNPADPIDDHPWLPERVRMLTKAKGAIEHYVGPETSYVLKARILWGLSWEEISRRCTSREVHTIQPGYRSELGWPSFIKKLTPVEVEALYTEGVRKLQAKFGQGWQAIKEAVEYKGGYLQ